jgi:hypothetical protein
MALNSVVARARLPSIRLGESPATRACTTTGMTQSEPLHWMRQQLLRCCEKPHGVRQGRMQFERSFIRPLGMDREDERFPQRLEQIDPQTTTLGA